MKWISVNDRLPVVGHNDFSRLVLVVDEYGNMKTSRLDFEFKKPFWTNFNNSSDVTHWMKLPKPPV